MILRNNPAHNGEALLLTAVGNAVGSPLLSNEYDPVTTSRPEHHVGREASVSVSALPYSGGMANLQPAQHAGSWRGDVHLPSYISGYFDGEGCFSVALAPRSKLVVGWEVRPSVSVSQNADRAEVVGAIHTYFGCGSIRPDPGDATVKWESRSVHDLVQLVLPHFRRYPLLSGKASDFDALDEICRRITCREHLTAGGLRSIVEIARTMNPSGRRRYSPDQILEDLATR